MVRVGDVVEVSYVGTVARTGESSPGRVFVCVDGYWFAPEQWKEQQ